MRFFDDGVGRKFIACMAIQFAHVLLLYLDKMPTASYEFLTLFIFGGYVGGNVVEKLGQRKGVSST